MSNELIPFKDTMNLAKTIAQSGLFQDAREASQAVVKILAGRELGFGPIASMTGVNIIRGRVTLSANLLAAAIKRHPAYNYKVTEHTPEKCRIEFYDKGEKMGESEFTIAEARQAGLSFDKGSNWTKWPKNMLFARALSNGAKWYCPDISGGPIYTPDEMGVEIDGESGEFIEAESRVVEDKPALTDGNPQVDQDTGEVIKPPKQNGGNGKKLPLGKQKFYDTVQNKTGGYYRDPDHLEEAAGWPVNWNDQDSIDAALSAAVDYAAERRQQEFA